MSCRRLPANPIAPRQRPVAPARPRAAWPVGARIGPSRPARPTPPPTCAPLGSRSRVPRPPPSSPAAGRHSSAVVYHHAAPQHPRRSSAPSRVPCRSRKTPPPESLRRPPVTGSDRSPPDLCAPPSLRTSPAIFVSPESRRRRPPVRRGLAQAPVDRVPRVGLHAGLGPSRCAGRVQQAPCLLPPPPSGPRPMLSAHIFPARALFCY
nr:formin-like protein 14 [Aegilops tauschii subsp. strangulata]